MVNAARDSRGFALVEVTVSLLLVSLGTLGLAGMQLSAARASYDAMQRSNAVAYAMGIMESMRANSTALSHYALADGQNPLAQEFFSRCRIAACNPMELATYELWSWRQTLDGSGELEGGLPVGGLVDAQPCIRVTGNNVEVVIAWRGPEPMSQPGDAGRCGAGLGDSRQALALRAFIGGRADGAG